MRKYFSSFFLILVMSLLITLPPSIQANENNTDNTDNTDNNKLERQERSYSDIVKRKATTGFVNIAASVLEIPKNIINTTHDSNILFGLTGGFVKGFIHMFSRLAVGVTETTTMFFPTKPIIEPAYPWNDFYTDTDYKPIFIYDSGKD